MAGILGGSYLAAKVERKVREREQEARRNKYLAERDAEMAKMVTVDTVGVSDRSSFGGMGPPIPVTGPDHGPWSEVRLTPYAQGPRGRPLDKQIGGDHYKAGAIQPIEFSHSNGLGFLEGNVVKYVTRYKKKGGKQDLEKAIHCLEVLLSLEYPE